MSEIEQALRAAFPHFQDGEPITPEAIRDIGREYMDLLMAAPQPVYFIDDDGRNRRLVWEAGDSSVGIPDGYVLEDI